MKYFLKIMRFIKNILPEWLRSFLYSITIKIMSRLPLLIIPFAFIFYGISVKLQDGNKFLIQYQGMKILSPKNSIDHIFCINEIMKDRLYEQFVSIPKGGVVLDIGANVGIFTMIAAKEVGSSGLVLAIEPEPKNIGLLRKNIEINGIKNVIVLDKAISARSGKVKLNLFHLTGFHSLIYPSDNQIEVEAKSLDDIVTELKLNRVDFIKIDAEGSELEILKGGKNVLKSPNIKLSIAAYHKLEDGSPEFPQIVSFLKERFFDINTKDNKFIYANHKISQTKT